jgi:hypothetical protein
VVESLVARDIEKIGGGHTITDCPDQVSRGGAAGFLARSGTRRYDLASMALGRPIGTAVGGCALALVTLVGTARLAYADKTYPVVIESTPTGATVYLDNKEDGPLGQTPYKGQLKAGTYNLIVELDRYDQHVQDVTIKKSKAVQKFKVPLKKSPEGQVKVVAAKGRPDVKNAVVYIDGKEWGQVPDVIKVPAGPHQVEVKKEGFKTFEAWIEVAQGEVKTVKAELIAAPGSAPSETAARDGGSGDDGAGAEDGAAEEEEEGEDDGGEEVAAAGGEEEEEETDADIEDQQPEDHARTIPFFAVGAGFELGGRRFRYANPEVGNLRPYDAGGVPLVRASLEVTPLAFSRSMLLNGWTLNASYARATPLESTAELNGMDVAVPTTWTELDVGLGYRYRFGAGAASYVGPQVGYGVHSFSFTFDSESNSLMGTIPDVKYKFIWLGLDSRISFGGRVSALASAGTRLVSETGDIGTHFAKTDVVAFAINLGIAATITRSIEARLVGRFDQYKHEFTPKTVPDFVADGGTDRFFGVTLSAAFLY